MSEVMNVGVLNVGQSNKLSLKRIKPIPEFQKSILAHLPANGECYLVVCMNEIVHL